MSDASATATDASVAPPGEEFLTGALDPEKETQQEESPLGDMTAAAINRSTPSAATDSDRPGGTPVGSSLRKRSGGSVFDRLASTPTLSNLARGHVSEFTPTSSRGLGSGTAIGSRRQTSTATTGRNNGIGTLGKATTITLLASSSARSSPASPARTNVLGVMTPPPRRPPGVRGIAVPTGNVNTPAARDLQHQQQLADMKNQVNSLVRDLEQAHKNTADAQTARDQLQAQLNEATIARDAVVAELEASQAKLREAETKVGEVEAREVSLSADHHAELARLQALILDAQHLRDALNKSLSDKIALHNQVVSRKAELEADLVKRQRALSELAGISAELLTSLSGNTVPSVSVEDGECGQLIAQLREAIDQSSAIEREREEFASTIGVLKSAHAEEIRRTSEQHARDLDNAKRSSTALQDEVSRILEDASRHAERAQQLDKQLVSAQAKHTEYDQMLKDLQERFQSLETAKKEGESAAAREVQQAQSAAAELRDSHSAIQKELEALREQIEIEAAARDAAGDESQKKLDSLERAIADEKTAKTQSQESLAELTKRLTDSERRERELLETHATRQASLQRELDDAVTCLLQQDATHEQRVRELESANAAAKEAQAAAEQRALDMLERVQQVDEVQHKYDALFAELQLFKSQSTHSEGSDAVKHDKQQQQHDEAEETFVTADHPGTSLLAEHDHSSINNVTPPIDASTPPKPTIPHPVEPLLVPEASNNQGVSGFSTPSPLPSPIKHDQESTKSQKEQSSSGTPSSQDDKASQKDHDEK
ncbi:hypothetical protein PYCC9005_004673 [Savitreella phatthalungensis]